MSSQEREKISIKDLLGLRRYNNLQVAVCRAVLGEERLHSEEAYTWMEDRWDDVRIILERHRDELLAGFDESGQPKSELLETLLIEIELSAEETRGMPRDVNMLQ